MHTEFHISNGVNAVEIERDLQELWKQMAEAAQAEGQQMVLRVCVLNLLIYAPGSGSAGEISKIMAEVSPEHPSRGIVMLPKPEAPSSVVHAWVTAQCHVSVGGRKQVCCEQIMVTAEGEGIFRLPSIVRSLLVSDLPVVLWWRDVPALGNRLFKELVETSDRVIIDSARLPNPEEGLMELAAFIRREFPWVAFSDLNWSRLTPWRVAVAGLFDAPDRLSCLNRLSFVEIECNSDSMDSISSQALLIIGWLASRLKWHPVSRPRWTERHIYQMKLAALNRTILIQVKTSPAINSGRADLRSLKLITESDPPAQFVVTGRDGSSHCPYLQTHVEFGGAPVAGKITCLNKESETRLLSQELEILGHDTVYEQVLAFLAELLDHRL
ncbi:MAG TPA: glucose-6-phosphate dehydrogenase assembly protein OpcA [Candidatus Limnocylindrales bacterium]|nr:glucose-6-phosphate dehydrogenase assembly protein OpcA [Candidatus Limnocylindrales bacterium]